MTANDSIAFLSGGGACGELVRALDWTLTRLGAPSQWPMALKTAVGILLHSRQPMFLWWGDDLVQVYNDAYVPSFGVGKHPAAMGQRGEDCWQEIWPIIAPQIRAVMEHGKPSWNVDHLVPIWRNGRIEEVYWTYGYSPVYGDEGTVGGALVVCTETTRNVLAQRRLGVLRALASSLLEARSAAEISRNLLESLAGMPLDVPFAAVFAANEPALVVGLDAASGAVLNSSLRDRLLRPGCYALNAPIAVGPWPEPVRAVLLMPLEPASGRTIAFGLSSRLTFDDEYQSFLQQIVDQVVSSLARTRTEGERRSLLEQAPVPAALLMGPDHVFELANRSYCEMVGRNVVGKAYLEAFPELRETDVPEILDRVYQRGEAFVVNEKLIRVSCADGSRLERFFNFSLEPMRNALGAVIGMVAVAADVTTQVAARRVLEETSRERARLLAEATAASRAKDEFLAMLGHELRNPLAPIITALDLMALTAPDSLQRERSIIERQARHLISLVDDLLDVSRVAQGKIELKRERVSIGEVVARAIETTAPLLEAKAHVLDVDVPAKNLDVHADPVRLRQVVANLLSNAAKYTPAGGRIRVQGRLEADEIVLRVQDNGIGIAEEQVHRLFELFFQSPRGSDRADGGLGLGLALVKTFVTLHGGTVHATSDGVGRGSVFEVRLPRATGASLPEPSPTPVGIAGARVRHRILVVDDNDDLSELVSSLLLSLGFEVRTAGDALTALEIAAAFRPAIALLDIGLPVMDGYELAAQLRARLGDSGLKLIAMTGYGQAENRERSRQAGFDRHLVKPVDAAALLSAIDSVTSSAPGE